MDSVCTQQERIDAEERRLRASGPFAEAMKVIDPAPERAAECELRLLYAMGGITCAERIDGLPTPAKMRKILTEKVKLLRKIEDDDIYGGAFRDQARCERKRIEEFTKRKVPPGSRPKNYAKFNAVRFAHDLLADFGKRAPGLTREGDWDKLAVILWGKDADLFDYMKDFKDLPDSPRNHIIVPESKVDLLAR